MTAETRIPQPPGSRGTLKTSKPLPSSVLASTPLKRHSAIPNFTGTKETIAKSPSSSSSSDSSSGKKCLNGDKAIAKISQKKTKEATKVLSFESAVETAGKKLIPQEKKDIPAAARLSISKGTAETKTSTASESLNQLPFECVELVEPDETKRITAEASARLYATPEGFNNDEFGGGIGGVSSTSKPLQQENSHEDDKVLEEVSTLETQDVSEGKNGSLNGSTAPKQSEGIGGEKRTLEDIRMRDVVQGIAAAWSGWRALCVKVLLPVSVLILCTILLCVEKLIDDELDMPPPPT